MKFLNKKLLFVFLVFVQSYLYSVTSVKFINETKYMFLVVNADKKSESLKPGDSWKFEASSASDLETRVAVFYKNSTDPKNFRMVVEEKVPLDLNNYTEVRYKYSKTNGLGQRIRIYKDSSKEKLEKKIRAYWPAEKETSLDKDLKDTTHRIINTTDKIMLFAATTSDIKTLGINVGVELGTFLLMKGAGLITQKLNILLKVRMGKLTNVSDDFLKNIDELDKVIKHNEQYMAKFEVAYKTYRNIDAIDIALKAGADKTVINSATKELLEQMSYKFTGKYYDDIFALEALRGRQANIYNSLDQQLNALRAEGQIFSREAFDNAHAIKRIFEENFESVSKAISELNKNTVKLNAIKGITQRSAFTGGALASFATATGGTYNIIVMPGETFWMKGGADLHKIFVGLYSGIGDEGYIAYFKDFKILKTSKDKYTKEEIISLMSGYEKAKQIASGNLTESNKIEVKNKNNKKDVIIDGEEEKRAFWTDIYVGLDGDNVFLRATEPYPKLTLSQIKDLMSEEE
ncbi:MAG: hypothetical protein ABIF12_03445 [bacterium]